MRWRRRRAGRLGLDGLRASLEIMKRIRTAVLSVVTALGVAACGGAAQKPDSPAGLGHIHGLGIDPADGQVYVAAHGGLFRIKSPNTVEQVAGRNQDTMGFSVSGPKTFLTSGHPAREEIAGGATPHLGLVRSTDAGKTWTSVSEAGTADFHSLQPAGSNLYAFDSQTGSVRVSGDGGRTWQVGARLQALDLAASEGSADRVYATTPQGVQVSENKGTTFSALPGAPLLTHLDVVGRTLIGIDPDGQLRTARTEGGPWTTGGRIAGGQATAFTAVNDLRLLVAVEDGTVQESADGGRTFSVILRTKS